MTVQFQKKTNAPLARNGGRGLAGLLLALRALQFHGVNVVSLLPLAAIHFSTFLH